MALVGLSFLELHLNIFVRLYYELPYQCALKKPKICEFLCSHFNIEYGSKDIFGILCFIISRKIKCNWNIHTQKMNCTVYGEVTTMNWLYQKWFVKFCPGDFLLDDAPRFGRPVEVDGDQIETFIENNQHNQHYFMWEITNTQIKHWKSFVPVWWC